MPPFVHTCLWQPDPDRNVKYNKLVQGSVSIHIDRSLVDKQIADKEKAKLNKDLERQKENEALLHLPPPGAIVMNERAATEGGLWVPKRFSELKKGDDRHNFNYMEGNVELRALRALYKLSFSECRVISRFREEEPPSDSDDDDMTIEKVDKKRIKLSLYMSKKKPKKRMADVEETGHLVQCDTADGSIDHLLGKHASMTTFDVSLKDCPDPGEYAGCVIVKRKSDPPLTDEPIVFGFARFSKSAKELVGTEVALGMTSNKKSIADAAKKGKSAMPGLNSVSYYSKLAKNAWGFLEMTEEDEINYKQFKKALDLLNIVVLEGRALRIFNKCDLPDETGVPSGKLSMTEFEVALMMNDAVPKAGIELTPLDSFYIFDVDGSGEINQTEFGEVVRAMGQMRSDDEVSNEECRERAPSARGSIPAIRSRARPLFAREPAPYSHIHVNAPPILTHT